MFAIGYDGTPSVIISHHTTPMDARAATENVLMDLFGRGGVHCREDNKLLWRWNSQGRLFFRQRSSGGMMCSPIQPFHPLKDNPAEGMEPEWAWDGTYEIYDRTTHQVMKTDIAHLDGAKAACARFWRATEGKESQYEIRWRHNRLMYSYVSSGAEIERIGRYQIRQVVRVEEGETPEPPAQDGEEQAPEPYEGGYAFEATFCGKRYLFDPFGSPLEAAAWALISECNNTTNFWMGLADKNREGQFPSEAEKRISYEMALLVGGKMQGYQECVEKMLRAMRKEPQS